jgi:dTDP-4-dehydrorhamnose reductase
MCKIRSISYVLLSRSDMDIASQASVEAAMEKYKPWAVINAAGYVKIDAAESNSELCLRENAIGPAVMAAACEKYGAMFLTFSSDMVFNGASRTPYVESDPTAPLNIYGMSKFYAETKVLAENPSALVIRTSSFFGPWDKHNFVASMIESIEQGRTFLAASDLVVSPTYVPDLVNNCLDLIIDKAKGIWHLTNPSAVSWADFAFASAEALKLDTDLIKITNAKQLGYIATRPSFSVLSSERGCLLPKLEDAIDRFVSERIDEHGVKRKIQTQTSQELITSEGQEVAISNAS